jgi:hypothetical protein
MFVFMVLLCKNTSKENLFRESESREILNQKSSFGFGLTVLCHIPGFSLNGIERRRQGTIDNALFCTDFHARDSMPKYGNT